MTGHLPLPPELLAAMVLHLPAAAAESSSGRDSKLCTPGNAARERYRLFAPAAPELLVAEVLNLLDTAAEIPSSREYTCSKIYEPLLCIVNI